MEWTGGCLCGEVRYLISVDPEWAGYCHCTLCRKHSGAPTTVGVMYPPDAVEWTNGEPSRYRSSEKSLRGFCGTCGSTLTWETPTAFMVFVGTLDNPEAVRLDSHCYTDTQLPWLVIEDDLRRHLGHDDVQWPSSEGYDPVTGKFKESD